MHPSHGWHMLASQFPSPAVQPTRLINHLPSFSTLICKSNHVLHAKSHYCSQLDVPHKDRPVSCTSLPTFTSKNAKPGRETCLPPTCTSGLADGLMDAQSGLGERDAVLLCRRWRSASVLPSCRRGKIEILRLVDVHPGIKDFFHIAVSHVMDETTSDVFFRLTMVKMAYNSA